MFGAHISERPPKIAPKTGVFSQVRTPTQQKTWRKTSSPPQRYAREMARARAMWTLSNQVSMCC